MSIADKVRSPCVSICVLDEQEVCTGCQRTIDEIMAWSRMSNDERRAVLQKIGDRERRITL
ncbi:MAG: DUF1289 domain-containing protein [Oleiphilaceae bacterium]|nr:DUF1289 domain-containing protein [Oleiphilaceae bacterium]